MNLVSHDLVDMLSGKAYPTEEFFMDINLFDIPETVISAVKNLPKNCTGISIRYHSGHKTREAIQQYADETGLLVVFT